MKPAPHINRICVCVLSYIQKLSIQHVIVYSAPFVCMNIATHCASAIKLGLRL